MSSPAVISEKIIGRINRVLVDTFSLPTGFRYNPEVGETFGTTVLFRVADRDNKQNTYDASGLILLVGGREQYKIAEITGSDWTFTLANLGDTILETGSPFSSFSINAAEKRLRSKSEKKAGNSKGWVFEVIGQFRCTIIANFC